MPHESFIASSCTLLNMLRKPFALLGVSVDCIPIALAYSGDNSETWTGESQFTAIAVIAIKP